MCFAQLFFIFHMNTKNIYLSLCRLFRGCQNLTWKAFTSYNIKFVNLSNKPMKQGVERTCFFATLVHSLNSGLCDIPRMAMTVWVWHSQTLRQTQTWQNVFELNVHELHTAKQSCTRNVLHIVSCCIKLCIVQPLLSLFTLVLCGPCSWPSALWG